MIRLNYGCDKRVRYCVLIFVLDIVPSVSTIQLDLKKPACGWTDDLARSLAKKYRVGHKSAIFEKGHRPILIKITFLESAHHQLSNGICRFEHFMTFRRTVCAVPATNTHAITRRDKVWPPAPGLEPGSHHRHQRRIQALISTRPRRGLLLLTYFLLHHGVPTAVPVQYLHHAVPTYLTCSTSQL